MCALNIKAIQSTKISVIGLGYIGLPTAAILATKGYSVIGVDAAPAVVDIINKGGIHIVEPDLDILVKSAVLSKKLQAVAKPIPADVFFVCVPTPIRENHLPDLSYVHAVTKDLLPVLKPGNLVILESTSPVGTTKQMAKTIEEQTGLKVGKDVFVAYCPERVLPGHILKEAIDNDRIIGGITPRCTEKALAIYKSFVNGQCFSTDASTAELVKLSENSYRDVNIAFANELSMISHKLDLNVWDVIKLANRHPRVKILNPGPGVGGHCIAVDPWFIVASAPEESNLIRTARQVNDSKPHFVVERAKELAAKHGKSVGLLGLTFKANVDDFRESPALEIAKELTHKLGKENVFCHDPYSDTTKGSFEDLNMTDLNKLLEKSASLILLVDHREYKSLQIRRDQGFYDTRGFVELE
jgi:UDP-N-acetyl-D-mannosaminuronic acid dehydrogenase